MPLLKHILISFLLMLGVTGFSQLDQFHYIAPMYASDHSWTNPGDQVVYISTPSLTAINYLISDGAGNILKTGTVSNSTPISYTMNGFGTPFVVDENDLNTVLTARGIQVAAADNVYCNLRARSSNGSQATSLTCKGESALGTSFRIGHFPSPQTTNTNKAATFGIYATENGTTVSIDLTSSNVVFHGAGAPLSTSIVTVNLDRGETYVMAIENTDDPNNANQGMIGGLVTSNKPISVSCGSWGGNLVSQDQVDVGIDQIVPSNKIGEEYAIVRGEGSDAHEQVMVVAHEANTEVFVNGNPVAVATLGAGDYHMIDGNNYISEAMYVTTSKPAYLFQMVLGSSSLNTQGLNFLPPISCRTPNSVNNIPEIESIGATTYGGGISIVTTKGATVLVNGIAPGVAPVDVPGSIYEMYKISGLTGDVSVTSSTIALVGFVGQSGAAGYGGYFSGFEDLTVDKNFNCLPGYVFETTGRFTTYQWFKDGAAIGGATDDSLFVSGSGNYTLEYTLGGCTDTSSIYLAVDSPAYSFSGDTSFCVGDSATLQISGSGLDSISWSTGDEGNSTIVKSGGLITARIYSSVVGGCYIDTVIEVKEKIPPTINLTVPSDTICQGSTMTITATHTGDTIWWNTGDNSNSINITAKGTYFADVRTGKSCFNSDTIKITDAATPNLSLSIKQDTICTGDSIMVTATSSADSLGWSTGLASNSIWIKSSGTYVFTAKNNPTCRVRDTVEIAEFANPTASISLDKDSVCSGDSIIITLTTTADSILWSNNDTSKIIVAKSTSNLVATIMNGNFCSITDTASPYVANYPIITLNKQFDTICSGDSSSIVVLGAYDQISWSDGGTGGSRFLKNKGKYFVTASNKPGCSVQDSISLNVANTPTLAISETKDSLCMGDSSVLTLLSSADSILWSSGETNKIIAAKALGWYTATVSNSGDCPQKDSIFIYVGDVPTISLSKSLDSICSGDSSFVTATVNAESFLWQDGETGLTNYLKGSGWHTITATNKPGCEIIDSVRIEEVVKPNLTLSTDKDTICMQDSTVLNLTTNASVYVWSNGATEDSIVVYSPSTYFVQSYILSSCIVKDSIVVTQIDVPQFHFPNDTLACVEEPLVMNVNTTDSVVWENIITANSYAITAEGIYTIEVFNKCGSTIKSTSVEFEDCTEGIIMPNVLTPNNDGMNDTFSSLKWKEVDSFELTIYNRWGLKVFYSQQENFTWDGTADGLEVSSGTYFWIVKYVNTDGVQKAENGFIELRR